jgi:hypothetical protein
MQLTGELSKVSLPNLLQLVRNGELTGKFSLLQAAKTATVVVEKGSIVHAEADALHGKEALFELFLWTNGSFSFIEIEPAAVHEHSINPAKYDETTDKLLKEGQLYAEQKRFLDQLRITGQTVLSPAKDARSGKLPQSALLLLGEIDGMQPLTAILSRLALSRKEQIQSLASLLTEGFCVVVEAQEPESMEQTSLPDWVVARLRQDNPDISQAIVDMVVWVDRVKCWMFQADSDFEKIKNMLEKNVSAPTPSRELYPSENDYLNADVAADLYGVDDTPQKKERSGGRNTSRRPSND